MKTVAPILFILMVISLSSCAESIDIDRKKVTKNYKVEMELE